MLLLKDVVVAMVVAVIMVVVVVLDAVVELKYRIFTIKSRSLSIKFFVWRLHDAAYLGEPIFLNWKKCVF